MLSSVVLLHGFTQTGQIWASVRELLAPTYRVVAPDLRGHGRASDDRPVTVEAVLADVIGHAPARFDLVGYSMGARIALTLALEYPEIVERLFLISGTAGISDPQQRSERQAQDEVLANHIEEIAIDEFADEWGAQEIFATKSPAAIAASRRECLASKPSGLAAALRGLGQGAFEPVWERVGELKMPVTLIVGSRDLKYLDLAQEFLVRLPQAKLVVVGDAGHSVHLEDPASVAGAITSAAGVSSVRSGH